jgi:hypothetical protein
MNIKGVKYVIRANHQIIKVDTVNVKNPQEVIVNIPMIELSKFMKENGKVTDIDVSFLPLYSFEDINIMHVPNILNNMDTDNVGYGGFTITKDDCKKIVNDKFGKESED